MVALVVGKPLGIMITAWLSTHVAGLKMAKGLRGKKTITQAEAMKMFRLSGPEGYALLERAGISGGGTNKIGAALKS
jgi:hypothetical protein